MKLDSYFAADAANADSSHPHGPPPRHILVYGPPKIGGKTAAVGKLAERFQLDWFDLEDGVKTLANPAVLDPKYLPNINLFRIPDKQTYPMAIETMLKVLKGNPAPIKICHTHGKVSCPICTKDPSAVINELVLDDSNPQTASRVLVIDSYSQLAESAMNYIMKDAIAKDNFDAKAGWDEYGKQGRILERIGSTIQVSPHNIVVISHDTMVEMEDGSKRIVPIGGTSNASKVFAKYFDDVVYCNQLNKSHRLYSSTTSLGNVLAGSRSGKDLKAGEGLLKLFE